MAQQKFNYEYQLFSQNNMCIFCQTNPVKNVISTADLQGVREVQIYQARIVN